MKYSLAVLALAAGVFADSWGNSTGVAYETITTTALTTYCPQATTLVHGSSTYTVTEATTLTITDCPCTITRPVSTPAPASSAEGVSTILYTSCPESASATSKPMKTITPLASSSYSNPYTVYSTGAVPSSTGVPFTGAASSNQAAGLAVAAIAGVVALAL